MGSAVAGGGSCAPSFFHPKVKTDMYKMLKIKCHLSRVTQLSAEQPLCIYFVLIVLARLLERKSELEASRQDTIAAGDTTEKLSGSVRPVSQTPYPTYDQTLRFFLPDTSPDKNIGFPIYDLCGWHSCSKHDISYNELLLTVVLIKMKM